MKKRTIFKHIGDYIDGKDYSSYTLQYPPLISSTTAENLDSFSDVFHLISSIDSDFGLYIHIPFCTTKCTFCRYFSFVGNPSMYHEYVSQIISEIKLYLPHIQKSEKKISSLYIGGGTPNILSAVDLDILLNFIFSSFSCTKDFQFCIEFNPQESDEEKLKTIAQYKCERLTIGVQSMNEYVLKRVNRGQDTSQVKKTIDWARKYGIPYINVDIMAGIQDQTIESFLSDITILADWNVDMIHIHPFCPTKRTIDNQYDILLQEQMIIKGNILLKKLGYISHGNDAPTRFPKAINKQLSDASSGGYYIGFGLSSVSYIGTARWINTPSLSEYIKSLLLYTQPISFVKGMSREDQMRQYIIYTMRYGEMSLKKFESKFGESFFPLFSKEFSSLEREGRVKREGETLYFSFKNVGEYMVDMVYFYDANIIKSLLIEMIQGGKQKIMTK